MRSGSQNGNGRRGERKGGDGRLASDPGVVASGEEKRRESKKRRERGGGGDSETTASHPPILLLLLLTRRKEETKPIVVFVEGQGIQGGRIEVCKKGLKSISRPLFSCPLPLSSNRKWRRKGEEWGSKR